MPRYNKGILIARLLEALNFKWYTALQDNQFLFFKNRRGEWVAKLLCGDDSYTDECPQLIGVSHGEQLRRMIIDIVLDWEPQRIREATRRVLAIRKRDRSKK